MEDGEALYTFGRYSIYVIDDHYEDGNRVVGYGIVNNYTGVVEISSTLLFHCLKWLKLCEEYAARGEMDLLPKPETSLADIGAINKDSSV